MFTKVDTISYNGIDYKVCYDPKNGISIESPKTGNCYYLLEGVSYDGTATSDIVFIMLDIIEDDIVDTQMINFLYGAFDKENIPKHCISYIEAFEEDM